MRETVIPDWAMVGITIPTGVMVIASQDLTHAELEHEVGIDRVDLGWTVHAIPTSRLWHLRAGMSRFTVVEAPTYPEALRKLMETWTPPQSPERAGLPEHRTPLPNSMAELPPGQ